MSIDGNLWRYAIHLFRLLGRVLAFPVQGVHGGLTISTRQIIRCAGNAVEQRLKYIRESLLNQLANTLNSSHHCWEIWVEEDMRLFGHV